MRSCSLLFVFALATQGFWANAAPSTIDDEERVRYDGDQLWRVEQNEQSKAILEEFEQIFGRFVRDYSVYLEFSSCYMTSSQTSLIQRL